MRKRIRLVTVGAYGFPVCAMGPDLRPRLRGIPQRLGLWCERFYNMTNVVGLAIFAGGIILLILGFNASQSFSSDVSRFFTGNPTDKSIWFLIGGAGAVIAGLVIAIRGARRG